MNGRKEKKNVLNLSRVTGSTVGIWMKLIGLFSNIRIPCTTIECFCELYLQGERDESYKLDTPQICSIFGAKAQF